MTQQQALDAVEPVGSTDLRFRSADVCNPASGAWCASMRSTVRGERLEAGVARDEEKDADELGWWPMIMLPAKRGLFPRVLNHCPFCGGRIQPVDAAPVTVVG